MGWVWAEGIDYPEPDSLDELQGPAEGTIELPHNLYWQPGGSVFDVSDYAQRRAAYRAVLNEGTLEDYKTYINKELLVRDWPDMNLPRKLVSQWEQRFAELEGNFLGVNYG